MRVTHVKLFCTESYDTSCDSLRQVVLTKLANLLLVVGEKRHLVAVVKCVMYDILSEWGRNRVHCMLVGAASCLSTGTSTTLITWSLRCHCTNGIVLNIWVMRPIKLELKAFHILKTHFLNFIN
jgi:hypothetical protein